MAGSNDQFKIKAGQHAAQAPALRERIDPSKFCGSLVLK
jgi:hypothetical protein